MITSTIDFESTFTFGWSDSTSCNDPQLREKVAKVAAKVFAQREAYRARSQAIPLTTYTISKIEESGVSGSYFLRDEMGEIRFVVKPNDEDCGCLNNPNGWQTLKDTSPIRSNMPLYFAALKEVLTYEIAVDLGLQEIAPKTILSILESSEFSHLISPPAEKLCSVQEFIPHATPLYDWARGKSNAEIEASLDQSDFEKVNLLLWITQDTDAHAGNLLIYEKGPNTAGIKKIDNGLNFPIKNTELRNALTQMPNAQHPLSFELRQTIADLNVETLAMRLQAYEMDDAIEALFERVQILQEALQKEPDLSIRDINKKMGGEGLKDSYYEDTGPFLMHMLHCFQRSILQSITNNSLMNFSLYEELIALKQFLQDSALSLDEIMSKILYMSHQSDKPVERECMLALIEEILQLLRNRGYSTPSISSWDSSSSTTNLEEWCRHRRNYVRFLSTSRVNQALYEELIALKAFLQDLRISKSEAFAKMFFISHNGTGCVKRQQVLSLFDEIQHLLKERGYDDLFDSSNTSSNTSTTD